MVQQQLSNLPDAQLCSVRLWTADKGQTRDGVLSSAFLRHGHASLLSISVIQESDRSRVFPGPNEMAIRVRRAAPWLFQGARNFSYKKKKGRKKKKKKKKKAKEKRQIESKKRSSTANQNQRTDRSCVWPDVGNASCAWVAEESIASPETGSLHIYSAVLPLCHRSSLFSHHIY